MSEVANRVLKNSGYLYFSMGLSMFVSLYSTRLILNALGSSDFGIFCIIGGAIGMLGFLNAAMSTTTQRFINYAEGEGKPENKKYFHCKYKYPFSIIIIDGYHFRDSLFFLL